MPLCIPILCVGLALLNCHLVRKSYLHTYAAEAIARERVANVASAGVGTISVDTTVLT